MEEISTSFCFICLLHLANEQGLKLESALEDSPLAEKGLVTDDADEETVSDDKKIGDIWDIKVGFFIALPSKPCSLYFCQIYRDPTASRSA